MNPTVEIFDTSSNSSAISSVKVNFSENIVEIVYNSNVDKSYEFYTDTPKYVSEKLRKTLELNESVGKLIHQFKKDQVIESFSIEE